ncbi:hypothetical protein BGX26_002374 [Mortierella sp. AD094]|nr:hypothetical protein BGX26_002374 [Mortierella sp. AD094]
MSNDSEDPRKCDPSSSRANAIGLNVIASNNSQQRSSSKEPVLPLDLSFAFSLTSSTEISDSISNSRSSTAMTDGAMSHSLPMSTSSVAAANSSSSSTSSTYNNTFKYAVYQPPPTKEQQQPQDISTSPSYLSLGEFQYLEPEQISSGTSTLVGSPMTPRFDSQGQYPWLPRRNSQIQQSSRLSPVSVSINSFDKESSDTSASTFRSSQTGQRQSYRRTRRFSQSASELEGGHGGDNTSIGPTNAAKTLGYHYDHKQFLEAHFQGQSKNIGTSTWEPHILVAMDDISLKSFTDDSSLKKDCSSHGFYSLDINQSQIAASSNASMATLLGQNNCSTTKSSSSTLLGGLLQKSKNNSNFRKLQDEQPSQNQTISTSSDGKLYSVRPKPKQFGKKKAGKSEKGGGGDGGRKALFSNERTFLQWIKFGILLGTTALTLCNLGARESLGFHIGISILIVAMSTLGYGALIFHRRDRSLTRRLKASITKKQPKRGQVAVSGAETPMKLYDPKEICYYDHLGPTILLGLFNVATKDAAFL